MLFTLTTLVFTLPALINAAPVARVRAVGACAAKPTASSLTSDDLVGLGAVADCSAASFPDECRNATQAAPFVDKAFADFGINTAGEKAALLSLMLFESGGFAFNVNHFPEPGRPGQGTRNMMNFPFILQYALDTPAVADQATALVGANITTPDAVPPETQTAVRELVLTDEFSFASAAWFYKNSGSNDKCQDIPGLVAGLQAGTEDGWTNYITQCVGTTAEEDRKAGWQKALDLFNAMWYVSDLRQP
ncbi:hypothetical protein MKEN_00740100 [Mycena kentingensis (nom. inval.)]|nr:hypothetical protein MKEN_00740100 [Mycena kentingensis (nom. inval.)]